MTLLKRMLAEKERLEKEISVLRSDILNAPPGSLNIHKNGSGFKYFQLIRSSSPGSAPRRKYIRKSEASLRLSLAEKALNKKKLHDDLLQLKAIRTFLSSYSRSGNTGIEKLQKCDFLHELINEKNISISEAAANWMKESYKNSSDHPEALIVPASGKHMVRSKSEAFITFALNNHGIPFRYECLLTLSNIEIYPDFTIMHPRTGQIIIWEHFGMMDDPMYRRKAAYKIKTYIEHGFIPNKNLFMTFESESHPFDFDEVIFLIENMLLDPAE